MADDKGLVLFRNLMPVTDVEDSNPLPHDFGLMQNYPNPFNPATIIKYSLPGMYNVQCTIYNLLGEQIITLVNEVQPAGSYEVEFDGSKLAGGIYIYRLNTGNYSAAKKMILTK